MLPIVLQLRICEKYISVVLIVSVSAADCFLPFFDLFRWAESVAACSPRAASFLHVYCEYRLLQKPSDDIPTGSAVILALWPSCLTTTPNTEKKTFRITCFVIHYRTVHHSCAIVNKTKHLCRCEGRAQNKMMLSDTAQFEFVS